MNKLIATILTLLPLTAGASIIIGNPNSNVVLTGSSTYISSVSANRCSSGVQQITVDQVLGHGGQTAIPFDEDLFCSMEVTVRWTPGGPLKTLSVSGFDTFKTVAGGTTRNIAVNSTNKTAVLQ